MTNPADTLADLRARHIKAYATTSDEVWDRDPICASDGHAWPCEVAEVLTAVEAEVAHRINPVIGWLRLADDRLDYSGPGDRNERLVTTSIDRLTEAVAFFAQEPS